MKSVDEIVSHEIEGTVVVTLSDDAYCARAMRTIRDIRGPGRYWGPLVYVAIDFDPPKSFCDLYDVEV